MWWRNAFLIWRIHYRILRNSQAFGEFIFTHCVHGLREGFFLHQRWITNRVRRRRHTARNIQKIYYKQYQLYSTLPRAIICNRRRVTSLDQWERFIWLVQYMNRHAEIFYFFGKSTLANHNVLYDADDAWATSLTSTYQDVITTANGKCHWSRKDIIA